MMYDHDQTTLDGGRTVHAEVFNAHSGITVMSRDFRGPFRASRAAMWGLRWATRVEHMVRLSDKRHWDRLKQASQL